MKGLTQEELIKYIKVEKQALEIICTEMTGDELKIL